MRGGTFGASPGPTHADLLADDESYQYGVSVLGIHDEGTP
jgi:hypothetical protein